LFMSRTSAAAFILAFIQSALLYWIIYYLPVYFQGVHGLSPSRSGIQLLPTVLVTIPFAATGGKLLAKIGRYRPFHHGGFALVVIGLGCLTLLGPDSSAGLWVTFQAIISAGLGFLLSTTLPATLAPLEERDVATATGTWAFLRSFGMIW
jgi:cyanate permease